MCSLREIPFQNVISRTLGGAALAFVLLPITGGLAAADSAEETFRSARAALVAEVGQDLDRIRPGPANSELRQRVLAALSRVPRHEFVPASLRAQAYQNRPLPIGHGQTISQPTVVALMTELLAPRAGQRVLEVGTGSGYQAAVLAALGAEVYTIEIVPALGETAGRRLAQLGYARVHTRVGDGYYGWAEHAPFDAIIVTAATNHIPPKLLEQLKPGGHLAIPLGNPFAQQQLVVATKDNTGRVTTQKVLAVRFVPLTGQAQQ